MVTLAKPKHLRRRTIINQLHQDDCNCMGQTIRIGNQVTAQPPMRQEAGRPPHCATTSRVQQQPQQQKNQHKKVAPRIQFTRIGMSLAQELQHLLKAELITLKAPLWNPNTSAPSYHPYERCAYHPDSPGNDTNDC